MINSQDLKDGVAVVTGASSGLGKQLVLELLAQGMTVAGLARSAELLDQIASESGAAKFLPLPVDISDEAAVNDAFAKIRRDLGPISVLINNAAVYPRRDILDETAASFMKTVQINLGGAVACTRCALEDMVPRGVGRIVNVTTYAGNAPAPTAAAYSVSKGAMRIFNNALVADLGDRFPDIVINEWIPGALNTQMGIPNGLDPVQVAKWGVKLSLWHEREMSGVIFERDRSTHPRLGFKRRIFNRLLNKGRPRQFLLS